MITILRGPRATLARYGVPSDLTMRWDVGPDAPAWAAMRAMLGQLRLALGDVAVQGALGMHDKAAPLVMVSLALKHLEGQLTPAQRRARDEGSGLFVASLPGAQPRSTPVARSWAEALCTLIQGRRALIIVPEIDRVDLTSLRAARALLCRAGGALSFLIGHDTLVSPAGPFEAWLRKLKARELSLMEVLPGTHVERVDLRNEPLVGRRGSAHEERDPLTLEAMRAAFDGFAFDAALRLALELSPKLEGAELREAHALAALSAMRLDPHAREDDFGVGMMEAGFLGALEGEADPKKRAHWAHQLGVVFARTRREVKTALKYADQAVKDAESAHAGYVEAWARLGRAGARTLAERLDEAALDLEAALVRLDDPVALRETPKLLLESTRAIIANERSRLAAAFGRREDVRHYRRIAEAHTIALTPDERPGYNWIAPIDDEFSPAATRTYHSAELDRARDRLEPDDEREAARALAGVEMCVGNAATALQHIACATRIGILTKRPPDEVFAMQLEGIVAAVRAGATEEAERDLSIVRADPRCEGDAAQADALAMLALVSAAKRDVPATMERASAAVAQAERSGDAAANARVRKMAADAYLALGKVAEARTLAGDAHAALSTNDAPEDALGVLVTLLSCGQGDDAVVALAVLHAAAALSAMQAWWELPRLLPHVKRVMEKAGAHAIDAAALAVTLAAAAQRADCAALVAQIRAI